MGKRQIIKMPSQCGLSPRAPAEFPRNLSQAAAFSPAAYLAARNKFEFWFGGCLSASFEVGPQKGAPRDSEDKRCQFIGTFYALINMYLTFDRLDVRLRRPRGVYRALFHRKPWSGTAIRGGGDADR